MIRLSVIVPCRNELKYIDGCIESILNQDFPKDEMEVLFVDGMSTDGTREVLSQYCEKYGFMRMLDNPQFIVSTAFNLGVGQSSGEVVMILGVHANYEPTYMSTLVKKLDELNADVVGCVCQTDIINRNSKSLAIKAVLSSRFGVGNSEFRTGVAKEQLVDTVPFGCYRRSVFERFGLFDERLVRNQDIEFSKRIINGNGKIYLIPSVLCTYYARDNYSALSLNNYSNGLWNIMTVKITSKLSSLSLRHFVPMLFLLSLILPLPFAIVDTRFAFVSLCSVLLYFLAMLIVCIKIKMQNKALSLWYLVLTFCVLHLSYGCGSLVGLFTSVKNDK